MFRCVVVFGVVCLAAGLAQGADRDLIAHYSFDEGAGLTVFDRTGGGRDGSIFGARYRRSPRGYALQFDGIDDTVNFGNPSRLNHSGDLTLAVWVRMDVDDNRDTQRLIYGDTASYAVHRNFSLRVDARNLLWFGWGDGETSAHLAVDASMLDGNWHHVAVTCDSTQLVATIYVDGKTVAQTPMPVPISTTSGGEKKAGAWWTDNAFAGAIDDIRIYRRALSAMEVLAAYEAQAESFAPTGQADPMDDTTLIARYSFNEGAGDVLSDHGPFSIDGKIHGATWIESPWGGALRFDGEDDYVDLGMPEQMAFGGDMTIELWLRADTRSDPTIHRLQKHRLIIGTMASLSVDRHFNLRFNDVDDLLFEYHGPNEQTLFTHPTSFIPNDWLHLVIVVEAGKRYDAFANGRLVATRQLHQPLAPLAKGPIRIGGWNFGHFKGDIDELRIYNRALSIRELRHSCGLSADRLLPNLAIDQVVASSITQRLHVSADIVADGLLPASMQLRLLDREHADVIEPQSVTLDTTSRNGRWTAASDVSLASAPPGFYTLQTRLLDADGHPLDVDEMSLRYPAPPSWLNNTIGVTDQVLPPHEPCQTQQHTDAITVRTWGRRHVFGPGPLLDAIDTQDTPLLAEPMRLDARIDGRAVAWPAASPALKKDTPAQAVVEQTCADDAAILHVSTSIEYDGFMRIDVGLEAKRDLSLDTLTLAIPLRREHATLMFDWPVSHSGTVPDDYHTPFIPMIWIGDEARGLCWVAESDEYWRPADADRAIEIMRAGDAVSLQLNLIGQAVTMTRGDERLYTFGLQATPVRPNPQSAWDVRMCVGLPYGHELDAVNRTVSGKPLIEHLAEQGTRAQVIFRWSRIFSYTLPVGEEQAFERLVTALHEANIKAIPYAIGFLFSQVAPEYRDFGEDMVIKPYRSFPISNSPPGYQPQVCYNGCRRGPWSDFCVASFAQCMDTYDVDGIYLDTTTALWGCTNRAHGCGYVREDGTIAPTYSVFGVRELIKRLYTVVKSRKPDGIVDVHTYDSQFVPALSFASVYWTGEQLKRGGGHIFDSISLERFRAEFMGHNLGVPAEMLYYTAGNFQACLAMSLIHDVPVRGGHGSTQSIIVPIWQARESFGCREATFHGYWNNADLVTVTGDNCYASLWRHPTNGVMVALSNLGRAKQDVRATFDREALGLPRDMGATDMIAGEPITVSDNAITIAIDAQRWALIQLQ